MTVRFIPNVIDKEKFLNYYNETVLINDPIIIKGYVQAINSSMAALDKRLAKWITNKSGCSYPLLPILNSQNTTALLEELSSIAREVALATADEITKLKKALSFWPKVSLHDIINHLILADLWQRVYSYRINSKFGGSIVVIDNPEECKVIYCNVIGISSDKLLLYWQNNLQPNNYVYSDLLERKGSIRMIRTLDSKGFILPYGGMESFFVRLKLFRTKRIKGSHVPSYLNNIPEIDPRLVKELRNYLREITVIAKQYFSRVKQVITGSRKKVFPKLKYVDDSSLLQAGYYTWCYAVYQKWIESAVVEELDAVKNVFGVK